VFGKTLRDSRRALLIVGLLAGLLMFASAAALATQFATQQSRLELVAQAELLPVVMRGLLGEPIRVDTLGGFLSWRVGNTLPAMLGIWSVLALSSTLAGEGARGSLDLLVSTPVARRRIALQKAAAHVVAVTAAMVLAAIVTWLGGVAFATLPTDEIPLSAALGHFALAGLLMLVAGSAAFAVAPVVGRTRAAALGFVVLFGGYLVPSYAAISPVLDALSVLSPFSWTEGHRPLAGREAWAPLAALAALTAAFIAIGVVAFDRRDLGRPAALGWLRLPSLPAGTGHPFTRQLADRAGAAIGWGLGIGVYGAMIAASAEAFAEGLGQIPRVAEMVALLYPELNLREPSSILQLAFFPFASLLAGLAAATFVGGWSGDERDRRLDLVLSTPVPRRRWMLSTGIAVLVAIVLVMAVGAALIGPAIAAQGHDAATPLIGMSVLVLYAAAAAGIGFAVAGVVRADLAAPAAGGAVVVSYLLELIGTILQLPDEILQLSLNHHVGQPMTGRFDEGGVILFSALAVGGLLVGTLGFARRDLRG
jgi:ABC-2 type transport system permease protein